MTRALVVLDLIDYQQAEQVYRPASWLGVATAIVHSLTSKHSTRTAVLRVIERIVPTPTVGNANGGSLTRGHSSR